MLSAIGRFIEGFGERMELLDYRDGGDDGVTALSILLDSGTAVILLLDRPGTKENELELRMFGINPKLQRHGYGGMLLRELTKWADEQQVTITGEPNLCDLSRFDFTVEGFNSLGDNERIGKPIGNTMNNVLWGNYLRDKHGFKYTGDGLELRRVPRKSE